MTWWKRKRTGDGRTLIESAGPAPDTHQHTHGAAAAAGGGHAAESTAGVLPRVLLFYDYT